MDSSRNGAGRPGDSKACSLLSLWRIVRGDFVCAGGSKLPFNVSALFNCSIFIASVIATRQDNDRQK